MAGKRYVLLASMRRSDEIDSDLSDVDELLVDKATPVYNHLRMYYEAT